MTRLQHLTALRDKVKAGDDSGFRRANRAVFSTPCQDMDLQLREEHCRHAYKGSLDAAKALHDSLLPGWVYLICSGGSAMVTVTGSDMKPFHGEAKDNPACAWLLSILEALIAQEGGE